VPEPGMLVWGGGCKVENVYINVRVCALFIKMREVCVKKPQIPVTSSLHFAYLLHGSYTKDMLTHAKDMQYLRSLNWCLDLFWRVSSDNLLGHKFFFHT
jgi:hypothetical protein